VNYADDFVILGRGHADGALAWTRQVMPKLRLVANERTTSLCNARHHVNQYSRMHVERKQDQPEASHGQMRSCITETPNHMCSR
jgi:hypothetical protein